MNPADLRRLWRKARERRRPLMDGGSDTTCFRMVHAEADGFPGVTLDWFSGVGVLSLYQAFSPEEEVQLWSTAADVLAPEALYLKRRPKEARVVANTEKEVRAPQTPVFGSDQRDERWVKENGLSFLIRPAQGLSVGLYLDMRDTRRWVEAHARGRTVLNCFAYTCGFSVAAWVGGAERAVSVDLSRRVLDWGEANLRQAGFVPRREDFLAGDVFDWLSRLAKKGASFSLVVLDPPGFSTTKKQAFTASTQYDRLAAAAARVTVPGGQVVSCCNVAQLPGAKFERMLELGFQRAGRRAQLDGRMGASLLDFPRASPREEGALKVRIHTLS